MVQAHLAQRLKTKYDAHVPRIGVGITTHNRPDVARRTVEQWRRYLPDDSVLVVVDDASDVPFPGATYRFKRNAGIARAKNKCLELLDDAGCSEFFLSDDDTYPVTKQWWRPYVESPEPHLMRIFKDLRKGPPLNDVAVVYQDAQHVAYTHPRGCLLYANRVVLERVGGMNPEFGRWGWEHVDWSNRIHNARLTTWAFTDVVNSDKLIESLDELCAVPRSVDRKIRNRLVERNESLYYSYQGSDHFIPYRTLPNLVVTTLLTGQVDPQRGYRWEPDVKLVEDLAASVVEEGQRLVVLHDSLKKPKREGVEFVKVPSGINPYFQRWVSIYSWLRDNADVDKVWCVDGTDVTLLRLPWPHMRVDTLYVGSEPETVGSSWMRSNHRDSLITETFNRFNRKPLLNAGLIGGTRQLVLEFCHDMCVTWESNVKRRFKGEERFDLGIGDMGALQHVLYGDRWRNRVSIGPHVNTTFRSYSDNGRAWWMHK